MYITTINTGQVAVILARVTDAKFWNPISGGWDLASSFVPTIHLIPMVNRFPLGGPGGTLLSAEVPDDLDFTGVTTLYCSTTSSGNTIAWVADIGSQGWPPLEMAVR